MILDLSSLLAGILTLPIFTVQAADEGVITDLAYFLEFPKQVDCEDGRARKKHASGDTLQEWITWPERLYIPYTHRQRHGVNNPGPGKFYPYDYDGTHNSLTVHTMDSTKAHPKYFVLEFYNYAAGSEKAKALALLGDRFDVLRFYNIRYSGVSIVLKLCLSSNSDRSIGLVYFDKLINARFRLSQRLK